MEHTNYRINTKSAVGEVIDGEAVIINLKSGEYFSADGAGAEIWCSIEDSLSIEEITNRLGMLYKGTSSDHKAAVLAFIAELLDNNLITESVATVESNSGSQVTEVTSEIELKEFVAPILNSFSDMKDLLLLDPIHDVSEEAGWPVQKN